MNIKKLALTSIPTLSFLTFASQSFAATSTSINVCPQGGPFNGLCRTDVGNVIGTAITYVFGVAAIIALIYLIYGGIRFILSQGDKSNVAAAREHIIYALVGLIIIFLSYVILSLVLTFFGINAFTFNLPSL